MSRNFTLSSEVPADDKKESLTVAVLGHSGVGKSTLVCRLLKHWTELSELSKQTRRKNKKKQEKFNVAGRDLIVHLLNTSYAKSMKGVALPNCDIFVLVYSIIDSDSFKSACSARDHIKRTDKRDIPIIFVANKTDIADSVEVMTRCSREFKITVGLKHSHLEISAETDISVLNILKDILNKSLLSDSGLDAAETMGKGQTTNLTTILKSTIITDEKKLTKKKKWNRFRKILRVLKV